MQEYTRRNPYIVKLSLYTRIQKPENHIFSALCMYKTGIYPVITQIYQILSGQYVHRYARILYPKKYRIVDHFMIKIIITGFDIGVSAALLYHQQVFELSKCVQLKF